MKGDRKASFRDLGEELDRRLGGLLGEVGVTLGEVLNRIDQIDDGEIVRERDFDTDRGAVRAGIRVKVGGLAGNRETQQDLGSSFSGGSSDQRNAADRTQGKHDEPEPARAIEATILTTNGTWTLIADLPGVDMQGMAIRDTGPGGQLILTAKGREREYVGRFDLPGGLRAADLNVSLINGILELSAMVPGA